MPDSSPRSSKRVLDPVERISEVWFGLIMVLTFTCSLRLTEAGRADVRDMLIGAIGCNLAWGIIDGFLYLMACFTERGRAIVALRGVREAKDSGDAHRIIADALPPLLASLLSPAEFESMRQKLNQLHEPAARPFLTKRDWLGALAVFLLVFLSTFPVVIPFIFVREVRLALHISNGIALVMLFLAGYAFGRHAGHRPWRMGVWMIVIGGILVALTIKLGG